MEINYVHCTNNMKLSSLCPWKVIARKLNTVVSHKCLKMQGNCAKS